MVIEKSHHCSTCSNSAIFCVVFYSKNARWYSQRIWNWKCNGENNTIRMIVVAYFDPLDPQWQTIYAAADKYPKTIQYVIINPCSGPCGDSLSDDWKNVISNLKHRGIKTLGYVFNTAESIANIDYYMKSSVPTDGIFFDNE